ncbi:MAG: hypothetical protein HDT43_01850 [Ruminococcaceae bacterium]|nr:hypothetical protein [Oscillospiraceae bacterium]
MKNGEINVRIPQITSLQTAIRLFYERTELNNSDIEQLFGKLSSATVSRLKNKARQRMVELGTPAWNSNCVNTRVSYEAWGLDIQDLESRYKKLKELAV